MSGKKSIFQTIVMVVFGLFAVLGLILFATYSNKNKTPDIGRIVIWGTIDQNIMQKFLQELRYKDPKFKKVYYASYPEYEFNEKVTDALAAGEGPDIIILKQDDLLKYKNKIYPISYEYYDVRRFKDTFVDGAEIFMSPEGILAIPFAVDPLVMFWNRDIFADNLVVEPPKLWRELPGLSKKMTERDQANNIKVATVALGTYDNVRHAKEIVSALVMQAGAGIYNYNYNDGKLSVAMAGDNIEQTVKAVRFFTAFANPVSNVYSWNRSMPDSLELFAEDRLAVYLGLASDLYIIQKKNPHLNFDMAILPQVDKSDTHKKTRTYGRFWAFAITKASKNKSGAFAFVTRLLDSEYSKSLVDRLNVSYVQRSLLAKEPEDPLRVIFKNSAIISHSYPDPDPKYTDQALSTMVSEIVSGQELITRAVSRAAEKLNTLLSK